MKMLKSITSKMTLVLFVIFFISIAGCGPTPTEIDNTEINTSEGPTISTCEGKKKIIKKTKDGEVILEPIAEYKVAGVIARKNMWEGATTLREKWHTASFPCDLQLYWGELANPEIRKYIKYNKWSGATTIEKGFPYKHSYIYNHSSRYYICSATDNIEKALKGLKIWQEVVLEGYIVNSKVRYKGYTYWGDTDLKNPRKCKQFYVEKVKIGSKKKIGTAPIY